MAPKGENSGTAPKNENPRSGPLTTIVGVIIGAVVTVLVTAVTADRASDLQFERDQQIVIEAKRLDAYSQYVNSLVSWESAIFFDAAGLAGGDIPAPKPSMSREEAESLAQAAKADIDIVGSSAVRSAAAEAYASYADADGRVDQMLYFAGSDSSSPNEEARQIIDRLACGPQTARDNFSSIVQVAVKAVDGPPVLAEICSQDP